MTDLAAFRTIVDNILATAVDASTWTTAIKDEALRQALLEYDDYLVYETAFTATATGYEQDLSSLTDLKEILALAYPWTDGADFAGSARAWRYVGDHSVCFEHVEVQSGETIRARHTKRHTIQDLDSATLTSVPERHDRIVGLAAALTCVDLRLRQISENPAIPEEAGKVLATFEDHLRAALDRRLHALRLPGRVVWAALGL